MSGTTATSRLPARKARPAACATSSSHVESTTAHRKTADGWMSSDIEIGLGRSTFSSCGVSSRRETIHSHSLDHPSEYHRQSSLMLMHPPPSTSCTTQPPTPTSLAPSPHLNMNAINEHDDDDNNGVPRMDVWSASTPMKLEPTTTIVGGLLHTPDGKAGGDDDDGHQHKHKCDLDAHTTHPTTTTTTTTTMSSYRAPTSFSTSPPPRTYGAVDVDADVEEESLLRPSGFPSPVKLSPIPTKSYHRNATPTTTINVHCNNINNHLNYNNKQDHDDDDDDDDGPSSLQSLPTHALATPPQASTADASTPTSPNVSRIANESSANDLQQPPSFISPAEVLRHQQRTHAHTWRHVDCRVAASELVQSYMLDPTQLYDGDAWMQPTPPPASSPCASGNQKQNLNDDDDDDDVEKEDEPSSTAQRVGNGYYTIPMYASSHVMHQGEDDGDAEADYFFGALDGTTQHRPQHTNSSNGCATSCVVGGESRRDVQSIQQPMRSTTDYFVRTPSQHRQASSPSSSSPSPSPLRPPPPLMPRRASAPPTHVAPRVTMSSRMRSQQPLPVDSWL